MRMDLLRKRLLPGRGMIVLVCALLCLFFLGGIAMAAGGGGETKGWVKEDTFKVWNFAVLAIGVFIVIKKWGAKWFNSRIDGIREELAELEEKKKKAEDELSEYARKLEDLEGEADKIVEEYIRQGNDAKARILAEAKDAAEKMEGQARKNIDNEFSRAKKELQAEVIEKALEQAELIIKDRITDVDQDRLVDEYLDKVVA